VRSAKESSPREIGGYFLSIYKGGKTNLGIELKDKKARQFYYQTLLIRRAQFL